MGTAAAVGLPYEIFSGDIKEVSDRTLRVLINDFRRFAEQRQWQVAIPMMCQPVIEWFAAAAILAGKAALEEFDDIRRVEHAPHGWAHIHPVQDPTGKKIEVDAGFRSRSSVVGERGDDVDTVDDERQSDDLREQKMGIGLYSGSAKAANSPPPVAPQPPEPKPVKATALETALANQAEANTLALRAYADALGRPEPEQVPDPVALAKVELLSRMLKAREPSCGRD